MNNNTEPVVKLSAYCKSKNISRYRLAQIVCMDKQQICNIDNNDRYNIGFKTAQRIYEGTRKKFGVGLKPLDYMSGERWTFL